MKKLVIFDLDGTLLDSSRGLTESMNYALRQLKLEEITREETKKYICEGTEKFAEHACGKESGLIAQCHTLFLKHYSENAVKTTPLCEGAAELLASLQKRDVHTAILTNKPQAVAENIISNLLSDYQFDCIVGHTPDVPLKPNHAGIEKILTYLDIKREDAMLVGDGESDARTAENAGIDFIGVLWGNRTKKQLKETGAVYFAKNTRELLNIILYKYGKKHVSRIFGEFKKFITKGNVLDMAVGVIIGAAFSAIVNSLVKDIINPAVSLVTDGISLSELKWVLRRAEVEIVDGAEKIIKPEVTLNYGIFIQAVINFLLIALTVFAIVKSVLAIRKRLDYNENIRHTIQEKLDRDMPLTRREKKWMIKQGKKDKAHLPRKTMPPAPPVPPSPPKPSLTDSLLMEILDEIKCAKGKTDVQQKQTQE